uniref:Uncharacterized protein n=1 Tax=Roseihalotalea indica TaxID=2867963 RepID=A0AA49GR97_9BACT|nr:hypothetical protein K4G66_25815 [Tunicatimonas sp. TK19036]
MSFKIQIPSLLLITLVFCIEGKGQTVVGMGTDTPNKNAVLELVSTDSNQGFLAPRLTTSQRNSSTFINKLTENDNGLLVFDIDEGSFYYWYGGSWKKGSTTDEVNATVWYVGESQPNAIQGKDKDFYIHQPTGDLYRKQGGVYVLIGNLKKNEVAYTAGSGISISEEGEITNTGDLDATNELQSMASVLENGNDANGQKIANLADPNAPQDAATKAYVDNQVSGIPTVSPQTLSFNSTDKKLSISEGNSLDLGIINTDQQDLSLSGNVLSLTNDGTSVPLSVTNPGDDQVLTWDAGLAQWQAETLNIPTYAAGSGISINGSNQISNTAPDQTVNLTGSGAVSISGSYPNFTISSTDNVNDADADAGNEIQDLQLSGNSLKVTNNASATAIDLSPYLDNTDSQDLSLSGTTLGLSGSSNTVDLSALQDGTGTDNQSLSSSKTGTDVSVNITGGSSTTFSVADGDDDANNELVTSAGLVGGDVLRIQEAGTNHDVDLSGFQQKTLPTGQVLVGNASGVAAPVSLSGDISLNLDGTMTITLDAVTTAKILDQAVTTAKLADNAVTTTKVQDLAITTTKLADDAVTKDKIDANIAGDGLSQQADGSLKVNTSGGGIQITTDQLQLANSGDGELLIGDGSQVNTRNLSGDVSLANTGVTTVTGLQGRSVSGAAPAADEVLSWNGTTWVPTDGRAADEIRWFTGTANPTSGSFSGGQIGDLYYKYDSDRYWRRTGTNPGDWDEIVGPGGNSANGQRMNGQLNVGSAPAFLDRKVGMLWLDDSGNGKIYRWNGVFWDEIMK